VCSSDLPIPLLAAVITAVITGASSGIGEGIAKGLALEGANVVLAARSVDKLAQIKREINEQGNENVLTVQTDVSIQQDIDNLVKKAEAAFDHIDVLVNNRSEERRVGKELK